MAQLAIKVWHILRGDGSVAAHGVVCLNEGMVDPMTVHGFCSHCHSSPQQKIKAANILITILSAFSFESRVQRSGVDLNEWLCPTCTSGRAEICKCFSTFVRLC